MKSIFRKSLPGLPLLFLVIHSYPTRALAQTVAALTASADVAKPSDIGTGGDAASPENQPNLRIGAGDLLEVKVFDVAELGQDVRVTDRGDANFLLIGSLLVAGLATDQAQALVASKLQKGNYVLNPQVSILIKEYSTQGVSVLGEVKKPGVYQVLGNRTLLDVISDAGGTTPFAGPDVTVKRKADGTTVSVRLTKDAQATFNSDIQLQAGDKVIVPRAGIVYVLGDVGRPGGFVMQNDGKISLLEAVAMAGGGTRTASLNHTRLIRKTDAGYKEIDLKLKKVMEGKADDPQLQPEDILYVPINSLKSITYRTVPGIVQSASSAAIFYAIN